MGKWGRKPSIQGCGRDLAVILWRTMIFFRHLKDTKPEIKHLCKGVLLTKEVGSNPKGTNSAASMLSLKGDCVVWLLEVSMFCSVDLILGFLPMLILPVALLDPRCAAKVVLRLLVSDVSPPPDLPHLLH